MIPPKHLLLFTLLLLLTLAAMCATSCRTTRQTFAEQTESTLHTDSAATLRHTSAARLLTADSLSQFAALRIDSLRLTFGPPTRTAADSSETAIDPCGSPLRIGSASSRPPHGKPSTLTLYGLRLSASAHRQTTAVATHTDSTAQSTQSVTAACQAISAHEEQSQPTKAKPSTLVKFVLTNALFLAAIAWLYIRLRRNR